MYSDFFLDRLCNAAPVLRVFKQGLEAIQDDWVNLGKDKLDSFQYVKNVFDELYHNFDDIELQYIANAIYAQAGAKESLEYLNLICAPYMELEVTEKLLPNGRFYDIKVKYLETEYVRNYQLFKKKLEDLVRDLLWYNEANVGMYSVFFECDIQLNSYIAEQKHIVNDKYVYLPSNIESLPSSFIVVDLE